MARNRILALGDIHGCSRALQTLISLIDLSSEDTLVMLGDAVDRGPDSRGVLELLLQLSEQCHLVPILGNHEQMLLESVSGRAPLQDWLVHGGAETLDSYGVGAVPSKMPSEHVEFISTWQNYYETDEHFYAHGNYLPKKPLDQQPWEELRWDSLRAYFPGPHCSGKTAILGHTSNKQGEILNVGHLICIDTYCWGGGWLTALEPATGQIWQANDIGKHRTGKLPAPAKNW